MAKIDTERARMTIPRTAPLDELSLLVVVDNETDTLSSVDGQWKRASSRPSAT